MNAPLLEARQLTKYFPVKKNPFTQEQIAKAVDRVDLALHAGETLGLAGESGCGKSTVARLLMGLTPPTSGEVLYDGSSISSAHSKELLGFRKDVQMIFQDPYSSLNPRMSIGDIISEPLKIHNLANRENCRQKTLHLMERVGLLPDHFDRYPHEFSGGQRQRIGIARALAVRPKVIIADEPVSALDISIQAQIINLLLELQKEYSLSYLFISHDLSVIRHVSNRIAIMYLGKVVEQGPSESVLNRFLHPYTEALLSAVPQITQQHKTKRIVLQGDIPSPINTPSGCHFHTRCQYAKDFCKENIPILQEKEPGHWALCHFSEELYRKRELQ